MQTYSDTARSGGIRNSFRRGEAWLDQRGKWAWITFVVLLFVFAWPLALVLLAYLIWGKQMFARSCSARGHRFDRGNDSTWGRPHRYSADMTGNQAFDSYKAEALRRLEDEQAAFEAFLQRLRNSKDKSEFDAFMEDRARTAQDQAQDQTQDQAEGAATAVRDAGSGTVAKPGEGARSGEY